MQKAFDRPRVLFWISFALGFLIILFSGIYTSFHSAGNDFWSVLYYGRHITWVQKESLYNGFFPIGYAFLIARFPYPQVVQFAYITNALLTGLLVASLTGLVAASRNLLATFFALAACITVPLVFQYGNTVGPDMGAVAFSACAIYILWSDAFGGSTTLNPNLRFLGVGTFLGLASLWRSHAVIFAGALLLLTFFFVEGYSFRTKLWMVYGFAALFLIQMLTNLISGHGLLETAQNFNIYKFLYGVDWSHPPSRELIQRFSLWEAITSDPQLFFNKYLPAFIGLVFYAWPALACFLLAPAGVIKRYGLFSLLITVLYALPVALGDSVRAPLMLMIPFLSSLAFLIVIILEKIRVAPIAYKWTQPAGLVLILSLSLYQAGRWVREDANFLKNNYLEHKAFLSVERTLMAKGLTSSTQVYSDYYNLYFPHLPPYQPRFMGGWEEYWLWGYTEEYGSLSGSSREHFVEAADQQGVKFFVLSPGETGCKEFFSSQSGESHASLYFVARRSGFTLCSLEK